MARTPSRNSYRTTSGVDSSEQLLESECPKMTFSARFQNSTFSQVVKILLFKPLTSENSLLAEDLACESETWLCVVQLIYKQSFSQIPYTRLTRNARRQPWLWPPVSCQPTCGLTNIFNFTKLILISNKIGTDSLLRKIK
jgi:hypothetical protein